MKNRFLTIASFLLLSGFANAADADLARQFDGVTLTKGYKSLSNHNPVYITRYGADPCAMIYNDEVFIYMTNDEQEYEAKPNSDNAYGNINTINCVSSKDMVNWTDHGTMAVAKNGPAKWASCSWAPTACHKKINGKEKFFLYFANNGSGIGVVTSDCPWGPWTDPIGRELISRSTPNCGNVTWLFDPAVLVDDDGTGYIYFGGGVPSGKDADPGTARVVKLNSDFISINGSAVTINPPYLFEDAGANKIAGKYIYSYCSNWNCKNAPMSNAQICYMTSSNPMGPFTYSGVAYVNQNEFLSGDNGGNNHHSMFEFKGKWYMTYHGRMLQNAKGIHHDFRSTNVDYVQVNTSTGVISKSMGSDKGVSQVGALNPFEKTEAETFAWMGGINTKVGGSNMLVNQIDKGDWIGVCGVDFGTGASLFTANVSSTRGAAIKICKDKADGEVIGYLEVPNTNGQLKEVTAKLSTGISGKHDLFFVFSGSFEFDYWMFKTADITLEASDNDVEAPADIKLTAKSTESNIAKINFLQDGKQIGSVTSAPYTFEVKGLEPGTYSFSAVMVDNGGKEYEAPAIDVKVRIAQGPYEGVAQTLPGILEVERYDVGGEGYAYHDVDDVNEGKVFRTEEGVDTDENGNGGYVLGWTRKGEWLEYTVEVENSDTYNWTAKVASGSNNSGFRLYIDNKEITDFIEVPNTDDWVTYTEISGKTSTIEEGKHILKLGIEGDYCNIDFIKFEASNPTGVKDAQNNDEIGNEVYSMQGAFLGIVKCNQANEQSALEKLGLNQGAYILKANGEDSSRVVVLTK